MLGRVRTRPRNYGSATLGDFHTECDNTACLVVVERRRLAGRAAGNKTMRTLSDLPGNELLKNGFFDPPVTKGGNQRDERSPKHGFLQHWGNYSTIVL